jgi:tetratricopeptide (TPR) repeat protein
MHAAQGFAGEYVSFVGRLLTVTRKRAVETVARLGGTPEFDVTPRTTLVVVGADDRVGESAGDSDMQRKLRRAEELAKDGPSQLRIVTEDVFCERAGLISPSTLRQQYYPHSTIRALYPAVHDSHLRYLEKWGLLRALVRTPGETWYGFADLAVIKQANDELGRGATVKSILRSQVAARDGQLAFDFQQPRTDASAQVVQLPARPERARKSAVPGTRAKAAFDAETAERLFNDASRLDSGDPGDRSSAMIAYRQALLLAPHLVPALVNLGNLHYAEDHFPEAQALYLHAVSIDPDCFEASFNLGNMLHDLGRFADAEACYHEALRVEPQFADAHFYLAVVLEKQGRSAEARPHWKRYQELAPTGEWVELAKEFTE